uniref:ZAD domain-containing protein n=1 Tax=Anopheles dirus TaxID=7168 RepID=A0A182NXI9_9DIPT
MTRVMEDEFSTEPSVLPNVSADEPMKSPSAVSFSGSDEFIVKSEVIISLDEIPSGKRCRLCNCADHIWIPAFNLGGGRELTLKQIETINRIADIEIRYETDFTSVVCSYCLLKIEEFTVLREVWQANNILSGRKIVVSPKPLPKAFAECAQVAADVPNVAIPPVLSSMEQATAELPGAKRRDQTNTAKDISIPTATADTPPEQSNIEHASDELSGATERDRSIVATDEPVPSAATAADMLGHQSEPSNIERAIDEQNGVGKSVTVPMEETIVVDDASSPEPSAHEEVIYVKTYRPSKRKRTKAPTKQQLIKRAMQIIRRQYRLDSPVEKRRKTT